MIIYVGDVLNESKHELSNFILIECNKIFSFGYTNILGLYPNHVVHNIMTYLIAKPIKKKPRKFNLAQFLLIKDEL